MILATLNDAELAEWARAWAEKNMPQGGNVQRVMFALCERLAHLATNTDRLNPQLIRHREGPTP